MNKLLVFFLVWSCIFCCSCGSQRRLSSGKGNPAVLSRQLGFKVTRHDDLKLYTEAASWLETPYRYGGQTRKGVDCSGLVGQIYREVYQVNLARSTNDISDKNCRKIRKGSLKTGDLVFFNTARKKKKGVNHVGLFLKDGYFIHASTSRGVMVNSLEEGYYRKTWQHGGRVRKSR